MIRFALPVALVLAVVPIGAATSREIPLTPCVVEGGVQARCGTFRVAENRAAPGGRTISLRLAVLPARDGGTTADPIVYIAGGPGVSAVSRADSVRTIFSAANTSRDIVLVDQRGAGGSNPLTCSPPRTPPKTIAAIREYAEACLASLDADPRQYTTAPAMDDLADVLVALGYRQVNVYGFSYGATAAQYFLIQHPELVRTTTLDGATLLDVPFLELWGRNGDRALRAILNRCARSKRCATAYPRVRREVFEVIAALRRKPVRSHGTVIDAAAAEGAIQSLSRFTETAVQIPWVAHAARRGDWLPLELAVKDVSELMPVQVMYWSIICSEPWARWDPERTAAASRGTYLAERSVSDARLAAVICSLVPKAPQPNWSSTRPSSDKPILFVVGGADPQDPLANIAGAVRTMPNSRAVVVPGAGHGSIQLGCVPKLARQFIEAGSATGLDTSCVKRYTPPPFLIVR